MPTSPTLQETDHRGYEFVETADWWKVACEPLPSFAEVWWPDYSTKVIEETIDGQPVVIQLWKGWCQRFLGRDDFPGGIGAEVCVYRRMAGRPAPTELPAFPPRFADVLPEVVAGLTPAMGGYFTVSSPLPVAAFSAQVRWMRDTQAQLASTSSARVNSVLSPSRQSSSSRS